jgi:ATP-dependent DNA helicase PIF1
MRPNNGEGALAVTAPTGIAAINIGGTTIHSFAGIGLGKEEDEPLAKRIRDSRLLSDRWKKVKTLIIDESKQMGFRQIID